MNEELRTSDEDQTAPQVASSSSISAQRCRFDPQALRDDRQLQRRPGVFDPRDLADDRVLRQRPPRDDVLDNVGSLLAVPLRDGLGGSEPHYHCATKAELEALRLRFDESTERQKAASTTQQLRRAPQEIRLPQGVLPRSRTASTQSGWAAAT